MKQESVFAFITNQQCFKINKFYFIQKVKELGTHILVCEVFYNSAAKGKLNFRKFFKFQVMKPLDVKTKFYNAEVETE